MLPMGFAAWHLPLATIMTLVYLYHLSLQNPSQNSLLYNYLVTRLFETFDLPSGPLRYLYLMNPLLPDHETEASRAGLAPHGKSWIIIKEEWPKIKYDFDNGSPSPLGLIRSNQQIPFYWVKIIKFLHISMR